MELPVITEDNLELEPVITAIAEKVKEPQLYPVITTITEKVIEPPVITVITGNGREEESQLYPVITTITDDSELFEEIGEGKYRWKVIQDGNVCVHINCVTERVRYCGIEEVKRFIQSYQSKIDKKMGDLQINEKWVNYWTSAYEMMKCRQEEANP